MKNCPFCKKTITKNNSTCPHCHHVLIEKIGNTQKTHQKKKIKAKKKFKKYLRQLTGNINWNNFKKYLPVLILVVIIIFISTREKSTTHINTNYNQKPISVIPDNQNNQVEVTNAPCVPQKDLKDYVSLLNGTELSKNSYYLNGLGELEIKNGTSLDAIAKLVNINIDKSVFTVYIKANSSYKINKIKDGNYKLFFNLGNDWNTEIKAFNINSGYEVFEDLFDFTTIEYTEGNYINTEYSIFEVTLNPIIGGQAETNNINAVEFANY